MIKPSAPRCGASRLNRRRFLKSSTEEWIEACKTGKPTAANFDYAGALTEANHLGNLAYRLVKKLEWDPLNLRAKNCPEADRLISKQYRKGWTL